MVRNEKKIIKLNIILTDSIWALFLLILITIMLSLIKYLINLTNKLNNDIIFPGTAEYQITDNERMDVLAKE